MKKQFSFALPMACLLFSSALSAQSEPAAFWSPVNESAIRVSGVRQIVPQKYKTFELNGSSLKNMLFAAPHEDRVKISESTCIISLPLPNGQMQSFRVVESPVMAPDLGAAYPDMKTFSVKGIDDPYANGKLDWVESGFHAMIRTVNGDFFMDPYCVGNTKDYLTYYTADFVKDPSQRSVEEGVLGVPEEEAENPKTGQKGTEIAAPAVCVGGTRFNYRLVVSCTGEYAVAATGNANPTVAQTLARIVTSVNRVTGVYESEVAIRLTLIPTQTMVIFTNAATDPFTANNNGGTLLGQNQTVVTNSIGSANYDIGHIFSTGGGGIANLGCVCTSGDKARGVTGSANPVGDPYDIDYVAHEMGHQFDSNHPFNAVTGGCGGNRFGPTSVEPGSGVTIMAYAGLCSTNDLASNSIPYFHAISYDEIVNFSRNDVSCHTGTATGNQPPVVTGSGNYIIPKSTAFILEGSATDPDGDALTYSWEETDAGTSGGNWNSGNKPFFRSYAPVTVPSRSFPKNSVVLSGNYTGTKGEYVPQTAQVLQFRLTARDNKANGGGVCYAINTVTVDASGPLKVANPNDITVVWPEATQQTVLWDVNGTDAAPVSCTDVQILISTDGGNTYSVLVNSTPNDGVESVTAPLVPATISTCRIKVKAAGNIFFDVSDFNFTIAKATGIAQVSQNNPVGLTAWPNPFSGQVGIAAANLDNTLPTVVTVTDLLGKIIYKNSYSDRLELKETIDLSDACKGLYFITVTNDAKQSVIRVVKD